MRASGVCPRTAPNLAELVRYGLDPADEARPGQRIREAEVVQGLERLGAARRDDDDDRARARPVPSVFAPDQVVHGLLDTPAARGLDTETPRGGARDGTKGYLIGSIEQTRRKVAVIGDDEAFRAVASRNRLCAEAHVAQHLQQERRVFRSRDTVARREFFFIIWKVGVLIFVHRRQGQM